MTRTLQSLVQKSREYQSCLHCQRHPWYQTIAPITLHEDGKCLICGSSSEEIEA